VPLQAVPWDGLADAMQALDDAKRGSSESEVWRCQVEVDRIREHLGALGSLLILMASEETPHTLRSIIGKLCGEYCVPALDIATKARESAGYSARDIDALRQRVAALERTVEKLVV
jgi:hypothetical protein